jgi:hypothetical protein
MLVATRSKNKRGLTEIAAAGPYGATIAHGYLTLSLLPTFRQQIYDIQNSRVQLNYGLNKVRFPGIVLAGSQLRGRAHLAAVVDRAEAADVIVECTVERDGADKPVCVAESVVRVLYRDSVAPLTSDWGNGLEEVEGAGSALGVIER